MTLSLLLTGRQAPELQAIGSHWLEPMTAKAFSQMQQAAAQDGIDLQIVSGYRSFDRQKAIWQAKLAGLRPVLNQQQQAIDVTQLQGFAKIEAVLLYSALPGASRHHWGTDLDVVDRAAVPADYQVQLVDSEYRVGGPFAQLALWLQHHAADFGFFLPYRQYRGGVAAEPWHLSYQPKASVYQQQLDLQTLTDAVLSTELAEQSLILEHLPLILQRYVMNICQEQSDHD